MANLSVLELDMDKLKPCIMNESIFRALQKHGWSRAPRNRYVVLTMYEVCPREYSGIIEGKDCELGIVLGIEHINLNKAQPIGNIFYRKSIDPKLIVDEIEKYIEDLVKCELFTVASLSNVSKRIKRVVDILIKRSGNMKAEIDLDYGPLVYRVANLDIVHLFDPVSLIEEARDSFLCHDIKFRIYGQRSIGKLTDFATMLRSLSAQRQLKQFYNKTHPDSPYFAIKLFSMTAFQNLLEANVKGYLIRPGTREIVNLFDLAFDTLNGNGDLSKLNRGLIKHNSPHTDNWPKVIKSIKSMQLIPNKTRLDLALRAMISLMNMTFRDAMLVIKEHLNVVKLTDDFNDVNGIFETPHGLLRLRSEVVKINNEKIELVTATLVKACTEEKLITEERNQFLLEKIVEDNYRRVIDNKNEERLGVITKENGKPDVTNTDDDDDSTIIQKIVSENPLSSRLRTISRTNNKDEGIDVVETSDSDEVIYNGRPISEIVNNIIETTLSDNTESCGMHYNEDVSYTIEDFQKENLIKFKKPDQGTDNDLSKVDSLKTIAEQIYTELKGIKELRNKLKLKKEGSIDEPHEEQHFNRKIMEFYDKMLKCEISQEECRTITYRLLFNNIFETQGDELESQNQNDLVIASLLSKLPECKRTLHNISETTNSIADRITEESNPTSLVSKIKDDTIDNKEPINMDDYDTITIGANKDSCQKNEDSQEINNNTDKLKNCNGTVQNGNDKSFSEENLSKLLEKTGDFFDPCLFVVKASKLYTPQTKNHSDVEDENFFNDLKVTDSENLFKVSPDDNYVVAVMNSKVKKVVSEKKTIITCRGVKKADHKPIADTNNHLNLMNMNVTDEYLMVFKNTETQIEKFKNVLETLGGDENPEEIQNNPDEIYDTILENPGVVIKITEEGSNFEINAGILSRNNEERCICMKSQLSMEVNKFRALPTFYITNDSNSDPIKIINKPKVLNKKRNRTNAFKKMSDVDFLNMFTILQTSDNCSDVIATLSSVRIIKIPETINSSPFNWIRSLINTYNILKNCQSQVDLFVSTKFLHRCNLKNYILPDGLENDISSALVHWIKATTGIFLNDPEQRSLNFSMSIQRFIEIAKELTECSHRHQKEQLSAEEFILCKQIKQLDALGREVHGQENVLERKAVAHSPILSYSLNRTVPLSILGWAISCSGMNRLYENLNKKRIKTLSTGNLNLNNLKYLLEGIKVWHNMADELSQNVNSPEYIDENLIVCAFSHEATTILKPTED